MKYTFNYNLNGRVRGAIGINHNITGFVKAENIERAEDLIRNDYEVFHSLVITKPETKLSTNAILEACGLYKEGTKIFNDNGDAVLESINIETIHRFILQNYPDCIDYVKLSSKGNSAHVWCFGKGVDHLEVFKQAEHSKKEGYHTAIYKVCGMTKDNRVKLGALNIFCNWEEEHKMKSWLSDLNLSFIVI